MKTRIMRIVWLLLLAHEARAADLRIGIVCILGRFGSTEQQMVRAGALAAAKEQSSQGETHVMVDWQVASEPSEESAASRVMAERKVNGIVLLGYDEESLHIAIIVQHVNGIPVVICGGSGPQSGVSAVVGTDNRLCGRRLMEALPAAGDWAAPQKAATAVDRYGSVDEVAALVAFVAGPEASYITGANLTVDGGTNA
jgi:DNA-binding LacI/PurR family transcriptional regulator